MRYKIDAERITARHCWCRDCQYIGAGSGTVNVFFPSSALPSACSRETTAQQPVAVFARQRHDGNSLRHRYATIEKFATEGYKRALPLSALPSDSDAADGLHPRCARSRIDEIITKSNDGPRSIKGEATTMTKDLELNNDNGAVNSTILWAASKKGEDPFSGQFIFQVAPFPDASGPELLVEDDFEAVGTPNPIDGIRAKAANGGVGVLTTGGIGVQANGTEPGHGADNGSGVLTVGDKFGIKARVAKADFNQVPPAAILASAFGTDADAVRGDSTGGVGLHGTSYQTNGVLGYSVTDVGVFGRTGSSDKDNAVPGVRGEGLFVGVQGRITKDPPPMAAAGVKGFGSVGVWGVASVMPRGEFSVGVLGQVTSTDPKQGDLEFAGAFAGPVLVEGDLFVTGQKSAAVAHKDGSHRVFHCVEAPEAWFEDFGQASLVKGKAVVKLDPEFATFIDTPRSR